MVAPRTLYTPAGVKDLAEDHVSGNATTLNWVVCRAVLHSPQQDISLHLPCDPCKKFSARRAERKPNLPLGARAHQRGRRSGICEGDDALQRMQRIAGNRFPTAVGHDILPIQGKVNILGRDKK